MWDLRWVLIGLGALVVIGVYVWSKGLLGRAFPRREQRQQRSEPTIGESPASDPRPPPASASVPPEAPSPPRKPQRSPPERIITLRLIPRGAELPMERAVSALQGLGLEHGRYGIFHRMIEDQHHEPAFSVASLTEPGTFDLDNVGSQTIAGLSLFVVLPGEGDAVARFDSMVETARALSVELEADLHDERGSSWSVQRERYIREEIIKYRHQSER